MFDNIIEFIGHRREHVPKIIELTRTVRFVGGQIVAFGGVPFLGGFIVHYYSFHMKKEPYRCDVRRYGSILA